MSNKSEATWHPNSGPEVPHADLIAMGQEFRGQPDQYAELITDLADALARLAHVVETLQEFRLIDESPVDALERVGRLLDAEIRWDNK